jgi:hypothetical protein
MKRNFMGATTIDTAMAKHMVEAAAIRGVSIIGQPGGWSVMLKLGSSEKPLGTQRTDKPRIWRSLDRCIEYLKIELNMARFDLLDATNHSSVALESHSRSDTSERMRRAHEAAAHDKWFREQVDQAVTEADDPATQWVPHDEAAAQWEARRAKLLKRVEGAVA